MRTLLPLVLLGCAPVEPGLVTSLRDARPLVIAHRGGQDLAPEHTTLAFEAAWDRGVDVIELDVRRSSDGVHYLFHDDTLDRTTDGEGSVFDRPWDELSQLDAAFDWSVDGGETFPLRGTGVRIATLEEAFAAVPDGVWNIDIKSREPEAVDEVVAIIEAAAAEERVCIGSFDDTVAAAFREALPGTCTYYGEGSTRWVVLGDLLPVASSVPVHLDVLEVPRTSSGIEIVTPGFVARAHRRRQLVWVWTVNEEAEMDEVAEIGVDGIITDQVDRAMRVFKGR